MITHQDIDQLSVLSFIAIPDSKIESFKKDLSSITNHIQDLQKIMPLQEHGSNLDSADSINDTIPNYYGQTLREDEFAIQDEIYSQSTKKAVLEAMPQRQGGYVIVKSVLKQ